MKLTKYTYTVQLPSGSAKSRAEAARSETADAAQAALAAGLILEQSESKPVFVKFSIFEGDVWSH